MKSLLHNSAFIIHNCQLRFQSPNRKSLNHKWLIRTSAPPWDRLTTRGTMGICQESGRSNIVLRPIVAGFAAVGTVVLAVFGEPDAEFRMAQGAVPVALAALFRLVADRTEKDFPWHMLVLLFQPREAGKIASRRDRPQPAGRRGSRESARAADTVTWQQTPDSSYRQLQSLRSVTGTSSAQRELRRSERTNLAVFYPQGAPDFA